MHDVTTGIPYFIENDDSYQTLIDEAYFTVIRMDGIYVCQVHLPVDIGEVHFELGRLGFVSMGAHAEDGVLEIMLRKLGEIEVDDDFDLGKATNTESNKEMAYA